MTKQSSGCHAFIGRFERFEIMKTRLSGENYLWHAVLTPMLNVGLLTPQQVIEAALKHANENEIPLNS